jgi:peptidoglycan/xylan/chitin deacetylase (PgdA/CDA1 family)
MRLFRPFAAKCLYPEAVFRIKTSEKLLYLTFDDGPHPGSTFRILQILKDHNVKSVFFCSGARAELNPDLINLIKSDGHLIGNHGYSHLNGWKTSFEKYISDVNRADRIFGSELFRPPYGHLKPSQYSKLKRRFRIIIWDLMPYDFDYSWGAVNTLAIMKSKIRPGAIIVMHDTPESSCAKILPEFLDFAGNEGYSFSNKIIP